MIKVRPIAVLMLAATTFPALAADPSPALRQVERHQDYDAATDWAQGTVQVTGRSFARPGGNAVQQEMLAVEGARAVAYARLAERVGAVRVTSSTTVGGQKTTGQSVETRIDAVVRGAREIGRRSWVQEDGSRAAEVTLQVCLTALGAGCAGAAVTVAAVVAPPPESPPPLKDTAVPVLPPKPVVPPAPPPKAAVEAPITNDWSSLVVNVGKMPFLPVLKPDIVTPSGKVVFSGSMVSRAILANDGAAQYAGSVADASGRPQAGNRPLVLNAVKITDDNKIVISEGDAQRIAQAKEAAEAAMRSGRVIIVLES
jgi:hypothetical protein